MGLELREECLEDSLVLGDEETTTRIAIDAMDESRSERETIVSPLQIVLYLIDDIGFRGLVVSGMDIDPGWLVDDHEVLILIEDAQLGRSRKFQV